MRNGLPGALPAANYSGDEGKAVDAETTTDDDGSTDALIAELKAIAAKLARVRMSLNQAILQTLAAKDGMESPKVILDGINEAIAQETAAQHLAVVNDVKRRAQLIIPEAPESDSKIEGALKPFCDLLDPDKLEHITKDGICFTSAYDSANKLFDKLSRIFDDTDWEALIGTLKASDDSFLSIAFKPEVIEPLWSQVIKHLSTIYQFKNSLMNKLKFMIHRQAHKKKQGKGNKAENQALSLASLLDNLSSEDGITHKITCHAIFSIVYLLHEAPLHLLATHGAIVYSGTDPITSPEIFKAAFAIVNKEDEAPIKKGNVYDNVGDAVNGVAKEVPVFFIQSTAMNGSLHNILTALQLIFPEEGDRLLENLSTYTTEHLPAIIIDYLKQQQNSSHASVQRSPQLGPMSPGGCDYSAPEEKGDDAAGCQQEEAPRLQPPFFTLAGLAGDLNRLYNDRAKWLTAIKHQQPSSRHDGWPQETIYLQDLSDFFNAIHQHLLKQPELNQETGLELLLLITKQMADIKNYRKNTSVVNLVGRLFGYTKKDTESCKLTDDVMNTLANDDHMVDSLEQRLSREAEITNDFCRGFSEDQLVSLITNFLNPDNTDKITAAMIAGIEKTTPDENRLCYKLMRTISSLEPKGLFTKLLIHLPDRCKNTLRAAYEPVIKIELKDILGTSIQDDRIEDFIIDPYLQDIITEAIPVFFNIDFMLFIASHKEKVRDPISLLTEFFSQHPNYQTLFCKTDIFYDCLFEDQFTEIVNAGLSNNRGELAELMNSYIPALVKNDTGTAKLFGLQIFFVWKVRLTGGDQDCLGHTLDVYKKIIDQEESLAHAVEHADEIKHELRTLAQALDKQGKNTGFMSALNKSKLWNSLGEISPDMGAKEEHQELLTLLTKNPYPPVTAVCVGTLMNGGNFNLRGLLVLMGQCQQNEAKLREEFLYRVATPLSFFHEKSTNDPDVAKIEAAHL